MKDGVPSETLVNGHCVRDTIPGSHHKARRHTRVLVTLTLLVIEMRSQGESKGIQADTLVPITRLKSGFLTSTGCKTKPTTPHGVGSPSDP